MLKAYPSTSLNGEFHLPGDKSISHRAALLGSLCEGQVTVQNFLQSEDCLHTLDAMRTLGVNIDRDKDTLHIQGVGLTGLRAPDKPIDCGNSGTSMRLLTGLLAGQNFDSELIGDASLSSRPMGRVTRPLAQMGANIEGQLRDNQIFSPLKIHASNLNGITYPMQVASAQVKSALMLATLFAKGSTEIQKDVGTRDHTERMLSAFGVRVLRNGDCLTLSSQPLAARSIEIPGDISSAAFFMVAATLIPNSHIKMLKVGLNPTRLGVIHILNLMGANIKVHPHDGFEPMGDIEVKAAKLTGLEIPSEWVVSAIDEFPILFIAASFAQGQTTLKNAKELRVKEVDRISVMAKNLMACGVQVETFEDGMTVQGGGFEGGQVDSMGDHRVAMAFAIAGCCAQSSVKIQNYACINTSFPSFIETAKSCGLLLMENKV